MTIYNKSLRQYTAVDKMHVDVFQYVFDINGLVDTLLISLEQDDVGANRQAGQCHLTIGFHVLQVCIYLSTPGDYASVSFQSMSTLI